MRIMRLPRELVAGILIFRLDYLVAFLLQVTQNGILLMYITRCHVGYKLNWWMNIEALFSGRSDELLAVCTHTPETLEIDHVW